MLARMHPDKAVSLDRMSKEMIELMPPRVRAAFHRSALEIDEPDVAGQRHHPPLWDRVPVMLIDKKSASDLIKEKRDISLASQCMKLQAALHLPAYEAVMPRLHANNHGWTAGVAARGGRGASGGRRCSPAGASGARPAGVVARACEKDRGARATAYCGCGGDGAQRQAGTRAAGGRGGS